MPEDNEILQIIQGDMHVFNYALTYEELCPTLYVSNIFDTLINSSYKLCNPKAKPPEMKVTKRARGPIKCSKQTMA